MKPGATSASSQKAKQKKPSYKSGPEAQKSAKEVGRNKVRNIQNYTSKFCPKKRYFLLPPAYCNIISTKTRRGQL